VNPLTPAPPTATPAALALADRPGLPEPTSIPTLALPTATLPYPVGPVTLTPVPPTANATETAAADQTATQAAITPAAAVAAAADNGVSAAAASTPIPRVDVAPPVTADVAAAEQYCIEVINARRAEAGLGALAADATLIGIARARVADMVARGYTGHNDPITGEALGRSLTLGAGFARAGENWYGSVTGPPGIVDIAMGWFMTDPPHYRNILNTAYAGVGVGIAYNGRVWLLVQNFGG
jgi:uncharacterized protein YkwD